MNNHLNLYRTFNETTENEFIENNLSRAFSLCLSNSSFFLNEYLRAIITSEDYEYLFSSVSDDSTFSIDIQIDMETIEKEAYRKIYAVAMTSDRNLNMDNFFTEHKGINKQNITDIFISIKDIAIVIEVKRYAEDCRAQLFNQVLTFINDEAFGKEAIMPISFSWQQVVKLLEKVKHVQLFTSQQSIFINDFLELSEVRYPEWFEPKPFNVIPFSVQEGSPNNIQLMKRMRQGLAGVSKIAGDAYQLLPYNDRLGISVPFGWASEVIPVFDCDEIEDYVAFYIWPGNTKQQGYSVYDKPLDWIEKKILSINGKEYKLRIDYHIKLCHFNRNVANLDFTEKDLVKPLCTSDNFHNISGKWQRDQWEYFEHLMGDYFIARYNWQEECGWEENFTNTDRSYFTMSLGFVVALSIPFKDFKDIDKTDSDISKVSEFISKIVGGFKNLLT